MKFFLCAAFFLALSSPVFALSVEVEKMDYTQANYGAISDTASVKYFPKCAKENFRPYEWKVWKGHYAVRSYVDPIVIITVKREPNEPFLPNAEPFILKALQTAAKTGANMVCYVASKKSMEGLGFESVSFRAYRQFLLSGHAGWLQYYNQKISKEGPLALPRGE